MTSNYVDSSGLHTQSLEEITTEYETQLRGIFGSDINLDPNSPDGQFVGILAQAKLDMLDTIKQVFNSFSPTTASGTVLDQRCAINGVARQGATYTRVPITIIVDQSVSLLGLDTAPASPFTISDSSGNKYYLVESATVEPRAEWSSVTTYVADDIVSSSGIHYKSLQAGNLNHTPASSPTWWEMVHNEFRAAEYGAVQTSVGTITTIETITLGVLSVSNMASAIEVGQDEETDAELRARRAVSVSIPSIGYLEGLQGALNSVPGVSDAVVHENPTSVEADTIPPHSIWCIVDGGTDADIGEVIYKKRNAGCGMKGDEVVYVTQPDGTAFGVKFDRPEAELLHIYMTLDSSRATHTPDETYITQQILDNISFSIAELADFTKIVAFVKEVDPYVIVNSGGMNTSGSPSPVYSSVEPTDAQHRFYLTEGSIHITTV